MSAPTDWAPDKRLRFTLVTSLALRVAQPGVGYRVRRPFSHWNKAKLIGAATMAPIRAESRRPVDIGSGLVQAPSA